MEITQLQIDNVKLNCEEVIAKALVLESQPSHLFTELTRSCNLRCFMCPRTFTGLKEEGPDMEWTLFEAIEKQLLPYTVLIELNGLGDSPLMKRWGQVIEKLESYRLHPILVTNGQNLDGATIDFFIRMEGVLRISVDAATPGLYERLRRGASFQKLIDVLSLIKHRVVVNELLNGNIKSSSSRGFALEFVSVISRENMDEIEDIIRLASHYGVETIQLLHMVPLTDALALKSLTKTPEEANKILFRTRKLARELGIGIIVPDFFDAPGSEKMKSFFTTEEQWIPRADRIIREHRRRLPAHCLEPWNNTFIEYDGGVKPCCASETVLGNLSESSFKEIWNGKGYQELRAQILGLSPLTDKSCKLCYANFSNRPETLLKMVES